jgi:hypothetical protein
MSGRWAARPALFTAAQYEELEHQALIYKYLVAGVPVPPDLLLPLRRGFVFHQPPARKHPSPAPPLRLLFPRTLFALLRCAAMAMAAASSSSSSIP